MFMTDQTMLGGFSLYEMYLFNDRIGVFGQQSAIH